MVVVLFWIALCSSLSSQSLFNTVANVVFLMVPQLDYFVRDSTSALGTPPIGCDIDRLIHCCRVCTVDGQTQVRTRVDHNLAC